MDKSIDEQIAEALGVPVKAYSTQYQYARDLPPTASKQGIPIQIFERGNGTVEILTFTGERWESVSKGLTAQEAPKIICEAILKFVREKKLRTGLVPGMCPKCGKAMDDHNNDCPTCGERHCDLDTCPEEINRVFGSTPRISDPNAKPYKCKFCGESRATWDEKEKTWRPPPVVLGKTPICPHCKKEQRQAVQERDPLKIFIDECAWTWCLWSEYKALCEVSPEDLAHCRKFANHFVGEMQTVLKDYVILRICLLVDKPHWVNANGDKIENLTIDNLVETLPFPAALKASLEVRSEELKKTVSPLFKARNRIIAHLDKKNAMENNSLGAMPEGAYERFFDQLEAIVNDMYAVMHPDPDPKNNPTSYSIKVNMPDEPVTEMVVNFRMIQHYLERTGKGDSRLNGL